MNCSSKNTVNVSPSFTFIWQHIEKAWVYHNFSYLPIFAPNLVEQVTNSHLSDEFQNMID